MSDATFIGSKSDEWDSLLGEVCHGVYHHAAYLDIDADLNDGTPIAWVYREGDQVLMLPLVRRPIPDSTWSDVASPYGYAGPISNVSVSDEDFYRRGATRLVADLRDEGVLAAFVRFDPLSEVSTAPFEAAGTVVHHGSTVAIDLSGTEEELAASPRRDHRREIRIARREGVTVGFDDWSRFSEFKTIYRDTMARVEAERYYFFDDDYFDRLRTSLGDCLHLALAQQDGEVIAGAISFEHDGIVQYHLSGTRANALSLRPSKLMVAEVASWAQQRGNTAMHLGGGLGGKDDNLFLYKAGFSHWHNEFATLRVVTDMPAYAELVAARNPTADPDDHSQFFPSYRRVLGGR